MMTLTTPALLFPAISTHALNLALEDMEDR